MLRPVLSAPVVLGSLLVLAACDPPPPAVSPDPAPEPAREADLGTPAPESAQTAAGSTVAAVGEPAAIAPTSTVSPAPTVAVSAAPAAGPQPRKKGPFKMSTHRALLEPELAKATAPPRYTVRFSTSQGEFDVACTRAWAPKAADRFFNLVRIGFYDDTALFRVIKDPQPFVVQFGIHGDPKVSAAWRKMALEPDEVKQSNTRGTLVFAMGGSPKVFTTQIFINYADNSRLDAMGFAPMCVVVGDGMAVADAFFGGYAGKPSDQQPDIEAKGNTFLRSAFRELDYIESARVLP